MSYVALRSIALSVSLAVVQVLALVFALVVAGCSTPVDEPLDPEEQSFVGPKADGFCVEPGSKEAKGLIAFVNSEDTSLELLDDPVAVGGVGLNRKAAESIVAGRPFDSLEALDAASYVGTYACASLLAYACDLADLCAGSCDSDAFAAPAKRTPFTTACEQLLLELPDLEGSEVGSVELAGQDRCEALSPEEQVAFDAVAREFGVSPTELFEEFGELSIRSTDLHGGQRPTVMVRVESYDDGSQWSVVVSGGEVALKWATDGLSWSTDWYCGIGGEPAEEPSELCVLAFLESSCAQGTAVTEPPLAFEVGEGATVLGGAALAAFEIFARDHALADDDDISLSSENCEDGRSRHHFSRADSSMSYDVVDNPFGLWVVASQGASQPRRIRCERLDESFCGGAIHATCQSGQVCADEPDECDPDAGGTDCLGYCLPES